MNVIFLGTGAADWLQHKKDTEVFFRRKASILIDEFILIDPGPDVVDAIKEQNVDVKNIRYILNTHKHCDHFNTETLDFLLGSGAEFIEINDEKEFSLNGYTVKTIKGNHGIPTFHYLISDEKNSMFYGLDGAWLSYDEVQAIKESKVDFVILDGTFGHDVENEYIFEHNNLSMVVKIKKALSPYVKRVCISHIAYNLNDDHDSLVYDMSKYGIEVAFDGMRAEL